MRALVIASPAAEGVEPNRRLAGMSLALRAVLTLQRSGVEAVGVVGDGALAADLASDARVTIAVEPHDGPLAERSLVTRHELVVSPAVFEQLLAEPSDRRLVIRGTHGVGPAVLLAGDLPELPPTAAVEQRRPVAFVHDASTAGGRRAALRALFEACRKPVDGLVSRHVNRHVSLFVSRLLVDTPVTPNVMTVVTFGVALLAAGLATRGDYVGFASAGVAMQINSILDGCDGELARVRFQGSKLGQWLDTVGDDLSNVIFWAAVGFGSRQIPDWGPWLAGAGYLAAAANGLAALCNYAILIRTGSGDFYALERTEATRRGGMGGMVLAFFNTVLRQDFFLLLVMIVALVGLLPWALPIFALGAVITLGASLARMVRFFSAARSAADGAQLKMK